MEKLQLNKNNRDIYIDNDDEVEGSGKGEVRRVKFCKSKIRTFAILHNRTGRSPPKDLEKVPAL